MSIDLSKSKIEILRELAEKLFAEAPECFDTTLSLTNLDYIYTENEVLFFAKDIFKEKIDAVIEENGISDGITVPSFLNMKQENGDIAEYPFILLAIKEDKDYEGEPKLKEEVIFNFFHEMMHAAAIKSKEVFEEHHLDEAYADVGAYLLYLREFGESNEFLEYQPFNRATQIISKMLYDEKGAYYTTDAMLAAKHFSKALNVQEMSFEDIRNLATVTAFEFCIDLEDREKLYDYFVEDTKEDSVLTKTAETKDPDIYRVGRQISLSMYYQKAGGMEDAEKFLQARDKDMGLIMDPVEEMHSQKEASFTENYIKSLIKEKPHLAN